VENWGAALYGDPCAECGYEWSLPRAKAVDLVAAIADRYAELLAGTDGRARHPDLEWYAGAYVCHVADNLRIWAERLAGAALGDATAVRATTLSCSGERGITTWSRLLARHSRSWRAAS
jgi:hypothetical protein